MVIPIGDRNPTRTRPVITWLFILANIAVFVFFTPWWQGPCAQTQFYLEWATVPAELSQGEPLSGEQLDAVGPSECELAPAPGKPVAASLITAIFLHGSWLHLGANMLYLGIFGNNIEDRLGHVGFLVFYLVTGVIATLAFAGADPASATSLVGASGAIAGVLGAYLVMYPFARVTVWIPWLLFVVIPLPAILVLGLWFVVQLQYVWTGPIQGGGVAYLAHVAGFVAGVVIVLLLGYRPERRRRPGRRRRAG